MTVLEGKEDVLPEPELLEEVIWQERDFEAQMTKDIFAWEYSDMNGLDPKFYQHKIYLKPDAVPVKQHSYRMNPNLAKQDKVEIDRLLQVGFITPIDNSKWLSPIVVAPKKNKKIRICVDYRKLNAAISAPFSLPFLDSILDDFAGHKMYSFLDGFSGYNQIRMAQEDQAKIAFIMARRVFACTVMWFGLRNAPSTFQRDMFEIFGPYLTHFMWIFLNDLSVFGAQLEHLKQLQLCFLKCWEVNFSLNTLKCVFAMHSGRLLGHVIFEDGISMDPDKIAAIMEAPAPVNSKQCAIFLSQTQWHGRHLRFVAHLAIPTNQAAHAKIFEWTSECDLAYRRLKIQLSKAPIMISPNWDRDFHVFMDASNSAVGSVLMQE
ncbi:hypothetical protein L7F22_025216 [Adiantum nelumboides]|nr:hypothetical protein [Adiantum nelumboides]